MSLTRAQEEALFPFTCGTILVRYRQAWSIDLDDVRGEIGLAVAQVVAKTRREDVRHPKALARQVAQRRIVDLERNWRWGKRNLAGFPVGPPPRSLESLMAGDDFDVAADRDGPAVEALRSIQASDLLRSLNVLTDRQLAVVRLYYWDGLFEREIGDRLGVCYSTVRRVRTAALLRLRKALAPRWGDE